MKNGPIRRMTLDEVQQALGYRIELVNKKATEIQKIRPGAIVSHNGVDFIVLEHCDKYTVTITKDTVFSSLFDTTTNNYGQSNTGFRTELEYWVRRNINCVSDRDYFNRRVDLTADNGCDKYGHLTSYFAPLSLDEFRRYYRILVNHQLDEKWWLVTPHGNACEPSAMVCVVDGDNLDFVSSRVSLGVRPVICFHPKMIVQTIT